MGAPTEENVQEKMWMEIIRRMEEMYAELADRHGEIEKKNRELEAAYEEMRRMQAQLVRSEKMRSLGRMAAGVAHEINNPLGGIIVYGHLLLEDTPDADARKSNLKKIVAEAEKCRDIVKDLLGFARPPVAEGGIVSLKAVLESTLALLAGQAMFHNVDLKKRLDDMLPGVRGDAGQLQQAFTNVILNAVQAMDGRGRLAVRLERRGARELAVTVSDTGSGIAPENMKKIFEPFFTTKQPGHGTGLGLAITYSIMEGCGGRIEVESEPGKGATFRMIFPAEGGVKNE